MEKELYWLLKYEDSIARFVKYIHRKIPGISQRRYSDFFVKLCLDKLRNSSFFSRKRIQSINTNPGFFFKKNITRKMNILMESYD